MDIKKLAPWNWFKKEEETGSSMPAHRNAPKAIYHPDSLANPIVQLHREMDRLFENAFRGLGLWPFGYQQAHTPLIASGLLRPQADIGATDKEYSITVEVPGVNEKDVKVEISNNTLTIRGEKKQEKEEKDKNYYRVERAYGSFLRELSLPADAVQDNIKATFKHGVLMITMPRKALPKTESKQIEIKNV